MQVAGQIAPGRRDEENREPFFQLPLFLSSSRFFLAKLEAAQPAMVLASSKAVASQLFQIAMTTNALP